LPLLSVVICTCNRAELLRAALESLYPQALDPEVEVLVIDNNSRDHTPAVAASFASQYPNVRYEKEARQGLSHARNRGWRAARGRYVGYLDDDATANPQWISVAKAIIADLHPEFFGGPYYPFYYPNTRPAWFKDAYASNDFGPAPRDLPAGEYLTGGNLFVRSDILEQLGGFDAEYGMTGGKLGYGEETELQKHARHRFPGAVFRYDPALFILHLTRPEKMTLRGAAAMAAARGRSAARLFPDHSPVSRRHGRPLGAALSAWYLARTLGGITANLLLGLPLRDRKQFPYPQNFLYERVCGQIYWLSFFQEELRQKLFSGTLKDRAE
jgi:glycosyltransferase involved in cell wall biosynthesis